MAKTRAEQAVAKHEELAGANGTRSNVLKECAKFVNPPEADLLGRAEGSVDQSPVSGEAARAAQRLINFIVSNTWQQGRENFTLSHAKQKLNSANGANDWFGTATDALHHKLNSSNFMAKYAELIAGWVHYGESPQTHRLDAQTAKLVFRNFCATGPVYTIRDAEGGLIGMSVEMELSAQQIEDFYNRDSDVIPEAVRKDLERDDTSQNKHRLVWVVQKRRKRKRERKDFLNMAYEALTVHKDSRKLIREEGFRMLRWMSPRFRVVSGENYGRGPTHGALWDIREQQIVHRDFREIAERAGWPALFFPDRESAEEFSRGKGLVPGGIGFYDGSQGGGKGVQEVGVSSQVGITVEYLQKLDEAVRENYFLDLLDVMEGLNAGASATEILERAKRQVNGMLPMVTQLDSEYFEPLIESLLELMIEAGELDEPPSELLDEAGNFAIRVAYHNELESKLKQLKNMNLLTFLEQADAIVQLYQMDPQIEALIPKRKAYRHLAQNNGVSADILNDETQETGALETMAKDAENSRAMEMLGTMMRPIDAQRRNEPGSVMAEMTE